MMTMVGLTLPCCFLHSISLN